MAKIVEGFKCRFSDRSTLIFSPTFKGPRARSLWYHQGWLGVGAATPCKMSLHFFLVQFHPFVDVSNTKCHKDIPQYSIIWGFLKWRYPKINGVSGKFPLKHMIWGYLYFRKPPYPILCLPLIWPHHFKHHRINAECELSHRLSRFPYLLVTSIPCFANGLRTFPA